MISETDTKYLRKSDGSVAEDLGSSEIETECDPKIPNLLPLEILVLKGIETEVECRLPVSRLRVQRTLPVRR